MNASFKKTLYVNTTVIAHLRKVAEKWLKIQGQHKGKQMQSLTQDFSDE